MTRSLGTRIAVVVLATAVVSGRADEAPYSQTTRMSRYVASGGTGQFEFDHIGMRLYTTTREGIFWIDVTSPAPRFQGPLLPERPWALAAAPDLGRLYFANEDAFGYLDLRTPAAPTILHREEWRGGALVYEPRRKAIYAPMRPLGRTITAYDPDTGERLAEITLPGSAVKLLKAVPGKVFFTVEEQFGLHVIDTATHAVAQWPVNGERVAPMAIEVDPEGRYMVARYERQLEVIDIASATVVARLFSVGLIDFAYDPGRRQVVVAMHEPPDHPRVYLRAYAIGANGFSEAVALTNPVQDAGGLISLRDGFLQRSRDSLLFWKPN
jgi:hypothetical protein